MVQQVFKKFFIYTLFLFFSLNCFAKNQTIQDIENYLNNIKYLKANFLQDDKADSELVEGVLYISRPGKLRLDYLNPFEASLYTNNKLTIYYDKDLDEITNLPTSKTPLHFLLKDKISVSDNDVKLVNFEETKTDVEIAFQEKDKEEQGTLILKFTKNPINLKSISLLNELNQEIEITLFDVDNKEIKNSVFNFDNPRLKKKI